MDKEIKGNLTYYAFNESLGNEEFSKLYRRTNLKNYGTIFTWQKDDEWLRDTLICKWKFNEDPLNTKKL
ncbi:MAG: hypothetical protein IPL53_19720 [Ignavibacteria bacterium]|nr:hypothetical protein [Ignavibacteria bacterium]